MRAYTKKKTSKDLVENLFKGKIRKGAVMSTVVPHSRVKPRFYEAMGYSSGVVIDDSTQAEEVGISEKRKRYRRKFSKN